MELIIIPSGSGKYSVTDTKERPIYSVTKKRKLIGSAITTLHDASGYALYTMIRTESGRRPAFNIILNDSVCLRAACTSMFVDPCFTFNGDHGSYELKGKNHAKLDLKLNGELIGSLLTESQANNEPKYTLTIENKHFDDYVPLFAVVVDKCLNPGNK